MRTEIKLEIKRLCARAFTRQRAFEERKSKYREKFERRTGLTAVEGWPKGPSFSHRHFDPWHCKRNANAISTAIWEKVKSQEYVPTASIHYSIPKPAGGHREVMSFSIPDAALANVLFKSARKRNIKRLSPFSYAYHPDRNVFDAILSLSQFTPDGKLFSVQIDFEKYFDSIPTKYMSSQIDDESLISLTPHERFVFKSFLRHKFGSKEAFWSGDFKKRHKGTPQGSSVSLLLANLANDPLDRELSKEAGKFVRYADDVVAFCDRYEDAQRIERCFDRHCENSGLKINREKSPGINLISVKQQEMRTLEEFKYLGYSISSRGLLLPESKAESLKQKISRLGHIYLISALSHGFNEKRCSASDRYDWDLLGLISEIRRALYGGLSEAEIQDFIYKGNRLRTMRGLMGFYCLLDHNERLKQLDGWLVNYLRRTMVHRSKVLARKYGRDCPTPNNEALINGSWLDLERWREQDSAPPRS